MVAGQLGKLQLTLRSLADATRPAGLPPEPTWASEVSPALRSLAHGTAGSIPPPLSGKVQAVAAPNEIEIIRGSKIEHACYSLGAGSSTDCGGTPETAAPVPPAAKPAKPHPVGPNS